MDGEPVWLASLSRRTGHGCCYATSRWKRSEIKAARAALERTLTGIGDPTRQRSFRMQITVCLHRQLSVEEKAALPPWFWTDPGVGIAGGPVEMLSETVAGKPSTRPCERKGKRWIDPDYSRELWLPVDCGKCEPCRARAAIESYDPALARV